MEKKAKVTKCTFAKEWKGDKSSVFYHDLELDNGDKGQIGCKEQMPPKLAPGCELTYTIESGQYGNKIKAVADKPAFGGGPKKGPDPKVQLAGFAMAYCKDLIVAGKVEYREIRQVFNNIHEIMSAKI